MTSGKVYLSADRKENAMNVNEMNPEELENVRQKALSLIERTRADELFREKVRQNPVEALTREGLPGELVGEFMRESQIDTDYESENDVAGYGYVCIVTAIP